MDTKQGIEIIDLTKEYEQKFAEIMTHDEYHIETAKLVFADEIYDHMEAQDINQSQLAEKLGSTKQYVSKLLSGYANPSIATLVKIARRLNCKFVFKLEPKVEPIENWKQQAIKAKQEKRNKFSKNHNQSSHLTVVSSTEKKNVTIPLAA
ncbi:MAG: helix-turn-helix transcriptional regulator [Candidatus Hinthialibacter antarcticus]|nr:helix-turn-helix transcriptional regulator [Candidatus Hinthialibacter antarcticus]